MKSNHRWFSPPDHDQRRRYAQCLVNKEKRFVINHAGRRSWKTETAKRALVWTARNTVNKRYLVGAPVQAQAKRIYWADIKALSRGDVVTQISDGELWIEYATGTRIQVAGMDKPDRVEGSPWDGVLLDEYGNMHSRTLEETILPMLADTLGWLWAVGVPEGRNHYYDWVEEIKKGRWRPDESAVFHWHSREIMRPDELASMEAVYDPLMFAQEFGGEFVHFGNLVYYCYSEKDNVRPVAQFYDMRAPLIICFDFNVAPGVANILQEARLGSQDAASREISFEGTLAIGEVHIPDNSNTVRICNKIIEDWGAHVGDVLLYGDATGGAKGSAKVAGSDWKIITDMLRPVFGDRLKPRVARSNPPEKARVNAFNSRLKAADGKVRLLIDPVQCPMLVKDMEGVSVIKGSAGEIDKSDSSLTHHSDAVGYYFAERFPATERVVKQIGNLY